MGDEAGLLNDRGYLADPELRHEGRWLHRPAMDWAALSGDAARRISGDLARLRHARIASGGAGAPRSIPTGNDAVLGIACGTDRVLLNVSGETAPVGATGWDRLTDARFASGKLAPWHMVWLGEPA